MKITDGSFLVASGSEFLLDGEQGSVDWTEAAIAWIEEYMTSRNTKVFLKERSKYNSYKE